MSDVIVTDHGSIVLLLPVTEAATEWIDENVAPDAQYFGNALAVECRYVGDIIEGMMADGLSVTH